MSRDFVIFKRGAIWNYRFQVDGQRIQRSTRETTRALAMQVAKDAFQAAKLRSRGEAPEPTLGELVGLWVEAHARVVSQSHLDGVARVGRLHLFHLEDLPLRELTTDQVEKARSLFLVDHARGSANHWLETLRLLLGWAIRTRRIRELPWQIKKLKVQRRPKVTLPTAKAGAWVAEIDRLTPAEPGFGLVVRLMIGMGLRFNEALLAHWAWLNWETKRYTPGKTKGFEAWERPVPQWLLEELAGSPRQGELIIPDNPGHPITEKRLLGVMVKANCALEVGHVTPHRLRGTYATLLSREGVPIQDIRQALGHKSILTTEGYLEVDLGTVVKGQVCMAERLNIPGRKNGAPADSNPRPTSTGKFSGERCEG